MTKRINAPVMKRRGPGIDAAFRSRQGRPASSARSQFGVEWTSREERLLERHYGSMSAQELKRRFLKERTIHAIRGRAGVLGLTRPMVHRPWTPRERALVRREFSRRGGLKRLIQALGRTQMAIAGQARYMGLSRRLDGSWTAREDAVLRRYYASHGTQLPLKGKTPSAIYHRAQQLKLRRPGIIGLPWSAAEDDLLRRHRHMQSPELAKLPPRRTSQAVQKRRKKLGVPYLVSPNRPNSRDPWSEAEREILRQHFELDAPMFLHLLPGRSRSAVGGARHRMRRHAKEEKGG